MKTKVTDEQLALELFEDAITTYKEALEAVEEAESDLEHAREDFEEAKADLNMAVENYAATGVSEEKIDSRLEQDNIEIVDLN